MLKENPKVGQYVIALLDDYTEEGKYRSKGKVYRLEGESVVSGNPYFINDLGEKSYIDECVWDSFNIYVNIAKRNASVKVKGLEVWARDWETDATDFSLHMQVITKPKELLLVLDELEKDIEQLIKDKYRL